MNPGVSQRVRSRAGDRCEYCRMSQDQSPVVRFHVEHIVARQHGGDSTEANLALACSHCNLHKGPNLTGIDPESEAITVLFHPRRQRWDDHFRQDRFRIVGITPTGRATVAVLDMNADQQVQLREEFHR